MVRYEIQYKKEINGIKPGPETLYVDSPYIKEGLEAVMKRCNAIKNDIRIQRGAKLLEMKFRQLPSGKWQSLDGL